MNQKHKRVYYHYEELEEFHAGMWRIVRGDERKRFIELSAALMRDFDLFSDAMLVATHLWPKSCEHNLTIEASNRLAYLGHAGCCVNHGAPEESTRAAWHTLSPEEQARANEAARIVLYEWDLSRVERDLFAWVRDAKKSDRH